ncbi:MORN repeat-containing protein [Mangrovivirga cuniculi]|uniref:MORN repeat-containing protein n=1 Tax=Mangrovivirga cuniculi TaxID=2715131 RepID=A0A4D7JU92_9BACT|nr:hypothetical protein [Mangrovivirga cuniculi]QCK15746.1 hypothetical protein DCC35_13840 [Mangrovivirga cuniculi]
MKRKSIKILTYVALAISIALAAYYFFRTQSLKNKVESSNEELAQILENVEKQQQILSIDSILIEGDYSAALKAYEKQLEGVNDEEAEAIRKRIRLVQSLMYEPQTKVESDTDSVTLAYIDSLEQSTRIATPEEIRQYDSLSFALRKVKVQVNNLQRQLRQKSFGQYITFKSSKGSTVHYVGQVKEGKANGTGVALLKTGSRYEGEWKNNQRHGEGAFYWPDGEYYKGEYRNDKRHGEGTYYWPNGEKFVGQWANDGRNGRGIFYGADGDVVASGIWKDDELVEVDEK